MPKAFLSNPKIMYNGNGWKRPTSRSGWN